MPWALRALLLLLALPRGGAQPDAILERLRDVYLELSTGISLPLQWRADTFLYSTAFPNDATQVAVRVVASAAETSEEEEEEFNVVLQVPQQNFEATLAAGVPSEFVPVSTEDATFMQLLIAGSVYIVTLIRSRLAGAGVGAPDADDRARETPPEGTLSGLSVWDSLGRPVQMAWFQPRKALYLASVGPGAWDVQLAATPNDPGAELTWRRDGGKWDYLVSGLSSVPVAVPANGWTLLDVRVRSSAALAIKSDAEPLVYQISLTREVLCHPKCHTCSGPGPEDCLSCFAPLSLREGQCLYTACSGPRVYFDDAERRCRSCDASCASCEGGHRWKCTTCPPLRFLVTPSPADVAGQCVAACPIGYFVQPTNQRCQRALTSKKVVRLYLRLTLRTTVDDFLRERRLIQTLLRISSQVLAVSPQDVRFLKWEPGDKNLNVRYFLDIENPFLEPSNVRAIEIDKWFAALPVPVDDVRVLAYEDLFPPPRPPKPDPLFSSWLWGLIAAGVTSVVVIYPMYHYYFIKMHFRKTSFKPKSERTVEFVQTVLDNAPAGEMKKVGRESDDVPR